MIIDYNQQLQFTESIDIVDIGDFAIKCESDDLLNYYLISKTEFGKTFIVKFGPVWPDLNEPGDDFGLFYKKIDYKEPKIIKEISTFVNDLKKKIVKIEEIPPTEAISMIPNFENFLYGEQ